jgi:hypothetical protein
MEDELDDDVELNEDISTSDEVLYFEASSQN